MKQLPAGVQAPDFELSDVQGRTHRLSVVLENGPAVLVFYKSSCPTSQLTLPYLQKIIAGAEKTADCALWAVSQDDLNETREFARQNGLEFTFLIDEHPYPVSSAYRLKYVPSIFIIEPGGAISLSDYGFSKATLSEISRRMSNSAGRSPVELSRADDGLPATRPG